MTTRLVDTEQALASRRCVFCGRGPLTKEHLWPAWLRAHFGDERFMHRHGSAVTTGPTEQAEWHAPAATQTAHLLCATCNNVWGSGIEGAAKPILLPMIRGHGKRLARSTQGIAAAWLAKTTMVFDRSHSRNRLISDEELRYVRAHSEPPPGSVAWISAYGGTRYVANLVSSPSPYFRSADDDSPVGWTVTLQVGALIMQMVCRSDAVDMAPEFLRATRDLNVQIWPTVDVRRAWPPKHAKDDRTLEGVSFPSGEPPGSGSRGR